MEYEHGFKRAFAHIIDILLITVPSYFVMRSIIGSDKQAENLAEITSGVILLLYMIMTEGFFGQSLGKKLLGIKVVMEDGSKVTFKAAIVRNLLRLIDAIPSIYIVGILVITFTPKKQRVGDLAAKTVVIKG